ncbi:MAG: hypothetical protein R3B70_24260 [Polyangiaceae bacterium]
MSMRVGPFLVRGGSAGREGGGRGGSVAKYRSMSVRVRSESKRPAMISAALSGPYQVAAKARASASVTFCRSSYEPIGVEWYGCHEGNAASHTDTGAMPAGLSNTRARISVTTTVRSWSRAA